MNATAMRICSFIMRKQPCAYYLPWAAVIILGGCFWISFPPDFHKDKLSEVTVIWDKPISSNVFERVYWTSTNEVYLADLSQVLDTRSWKSISIFPTWHRTRIILVTQSGGEWEIHLSGFEGKPEDMVLGSSGRAGIIQGWEPFIRKLTSMIEADTEAPADLITCYSSPLYYDKAKLQIHDSTRKQLIRFPGDDRAPFTEFLK